MAEKKVKGKIKAKVTAQKGKAIKPKLGRGTGGYITTSVKLMVNDRNKKKEQSSKKSSNG